MQDQNLILLQKLADILGSNAQFVVEQYANWFIVSALFWIVLGLVGIALSAWAIFRARKTGDFGEMGWKAWVCGAAIFFGVLIIGGNVPDLCNPKAAAIHQLLKDVRGQ